MGDIIKKVGNQSAESQIGYHIFLAAMLTVTASDNLPAIQAVFLNSFLIVGHR